MFFEPRPKDNRADLYDRDDEYERLKSLVSKKTPLILIKGLRRTGKTSLVRTYLNEEKHLHAWVDLRALAPKDKINKDEILGVFESSINRCISNAEGIAGKFLERMSRINGVSVMGNGISFENKPDPINDLCNAFKGLGEWVGTEVYFTDMVILVIDEAQYLSNVSNMDMRKFLAFLYDNCKNITVILCGSEIGLLEKFVKNVGESYTNRSSLSGLDKEVVELSYLARSQQKEYLEKGFEQIDPDYQKRSNFNEIISEAIDTFGGVIGWLNNFGVHFKSGTPLSNEPIRKVSQDAIQIIKGEIESLCSVRSNPEAYRKVMHSLSLHDKLEWDKIAKFLTELPSDVLESVRDDLLDKGFIAKIDAFDEYYIPDPLCRHYFREKPY